MGALGAFGGIVGSIILGLVGKFVYDQRKKKNGENSEEEGKEKENPVHVEPVESQKQIEGDDLVK